MRKKLNHSELVNHLIDNIIERSTDSELFVVGITGLDASGKSKLATEITSKLLSLHKNTISLSGDSFQYPRKYKEDFVEQSWALQHIRRTINFERMVSSVLEPLQSHPSSLSLSTVDYDTGKKSEQLIQITYPVIVIIESIYLLQPTIVPYLDYKIFLEISPATALARALARPRDMELYGSKEGIENKYTTKNFSGYKLFNETTKPQQFADIIIDNNDWKSPVILDSA